MDQVGPDVENRVAAFLDRGGRHAGDRPTVVLVHASQILDNGPELTAASVRHRLARIGVKALFIESGSPWENGHVESFNGKLRDECLNGEIFETLPGGPGADRTLAA